MNLADKRNQTAPTDDDPPSSRIFQRITARARNLTNAAITLLVRTHKKRWHEVAHNPNPHWDWRNKIISDLVPPGSSVVDLGCGAQTLRRHLPPECSYQPCDVIKSTPDVIFCDFNEGIYPEIRDAFDFVICSGVIEYIRDPRAFLEKISTYGKTLILSYCPLVPGQRKLDRLAVNWINHLTKEQIEDLFQKCGLTAQTVNVQEHGETIYSIERSDRKSVLTAKTDAPPAVLAAKEPK